MGLQVDIINSGFFTSVQDNGRYGYADLGVPESGATDKRAYYLANALLNNDSNAAMLECTLIGPTITSAIDTYIVITGALAMVTIDGVTVEHSKPTFVRSGQKVVVGKIFNGCRLYLAIAGGIDTKVILGSRSWLLPITKYQKLSDGMKLPVGTTNYGTKKGANLKTVNDTFIIDNTNILVKRGPEYNMLSRTQKNLLVTTIFSISALWNRMAIQLNEVIENDLQDILTSPVIPGVIQLTPSGKLIILMKDCQTTGGYPRVLIVTKRGLLKLAQLQQGSTLELSIT